MPYKHRSFQFAMVVTGLALAGLSQAAHGQPLPQIPSGNRSPNPRVNIKYITAVRHDDRSNAVTPPAKSSSADDKRREIEQALQDGNEARDSSNFEKALASYHRVADELDPKDGRAAYGLGNLYFDLACTDNAIKAYNEAIELKKNFRDAIIALASAYVSKERFDEAEAQYNVLLHADSKDVAAKLGLAVIAGKRKQYDNAIKDLNQISDNSSIADKDRANAHLILGDIFMEQKKYPDAAAEFKKVIELKYFLPGAYIKLGQTELYPAMRRFSEITNDEARIEDREKIIKAAKFAADNIRKAIYEHNYSHPVGYLWLANALMSQMSYQEAESNLVIYLRKMKDLQSRTPVLANNCDYGFNRLVGFAYMSFALLYNQQATRENDENRKIAFEEKAIENAKELLRVQDNDAGAYGVLAQIYLRRNKFGEAIEALGKAIINETNTQNKAGEYELLGLVYSRVNRDADAIAASNEALKLRPNSVAARMNLAGISEKQSNFDEAIRLKKEAIALMAEPTASSYYMLASTYLKKARQKNSAVDFEEAVNWLNKALEVNPSFGAGYFLLGQTYKFYKGADHADKALTNYEMAAKLNPNNASIYFQIGDLYYSIKGNNDAAIKYLKDSVRLDPGLAGAYWELGAVYADIGNDSEATKYYLEAIRADDKYEDAYIGLISLYRKQKNYSEAIKLLNKLFEIAPKEYWSYKEMAKIFEAQQKNDDAIRYYQQASSLLPAGNAFWKDLYGCRIERLRGHIPEAISCFQHLNLPAGEDPGTIIYDVGVTYISSKNKKAALAQHDELVRLQSSLAADLISQISDMK
jgi:tetratricopeptide (TPR) repeat protein